MVVLPGRGISAGWKNGGWSAGKQRCREGPGDCGWHLHPCFLYSCLHHAAAERKVHTFPCSWSNPHMQGQGCSNDSVWMLQIPAHCCNANFSLSLLPRLLGRHPGAVWNPEPIFCFPSPHSCHHGKMGTLQRSSLVNLHLKPIKTPSLALWKCPAGCL